jgi:hypothetical protein
VLDIIRARARFHRQIVLKLTETGRARLLKLNDTVLKLIDRCSTSKASAHNRRHQPLWREACKRRKSLSKGADVVLNDGTAKEDTAADRAR